MKNTIISVITKTKTLERNKPKKGPKLAEIAQSIRSKIVFTQK
jgi:hypothetical protein